MPSSGLPPFPEYIKNLNSSSEVEIDLSKPLKLYLRSTELVFKQAAIYFGEGDLEKSFILFMKFSNLVLEKLPKHPEYGKLEFSAQKSKLKEMCRKSIAKLEIIRPKLEQIYNETVEAETAALEQANRLERERIALKGETERLHKLKNEQENLRITNSKSSPDISLVPNTPNATSQSSPSYYTFPPPYASNEYVSDKNYSVHDANVTLKSLQDKIGISGSNNSASGENSFPTPIPKFFSEGGAALRPVHIPQCLISKFLQLASKNTQKNLETCGVLAGKLQHNEFTITCLIIPKQVATSDTCAMINEEEIITAQDSLDVMSLGWIHTHPTQKCFLSSVDLHTHMPFQLLMAESIAIVCAPTQNPNFGIFRLTDPPGLELITNCQHPSAFHPHPDNVPIYRELKGPESHAQLSLDLPLEVIDLRK